ncbi:phosphoribosylamine--glycine ligase [Evansella sp. LMS18]|uniref:phosphoribosylamine--glycine ligase n=1 Tax=Evansella sp. LMS18 TaxID=2924033 RepID=UPI0020D14134|nr:phosphoribosylamine--glycine ligase [Evansella sp. LMS18]UTR08823.1 phosphoribosylamine--glycine ligase [Evansella sp. LMS18]
MKVLVIGSGGREHALCWKLKESKLATEVFAAPGSDGISEEGVTSVNIAVSDHTGLLHFAKENDIGLTIVGPEDPLVNGIVDLFQNEGLMIFGPSEAAARLEGSKQYAKEIMHKYNIPTAAYESFTEAEPAKNYVRQQGAPIVIKADGLAAGKGVVVALTEEEALKALDEMMEDRAFGEAGSQVVIEEFLEGEEVSLMAFVHGETVIPMVPAQDHKRAFDGDKGPNTGGMGAYSPVPHVSSSIINEAEEKILQPMANAMVKEGASFTGILYAGLMVTENGPKVIEFNVRFGDPETQVVLPRLQSDLAEVIINLMNGENPELTWSEKACAGVVLASEGYPGIYEKGAAFTLPEVSAHQEQKWFHAGSKRHATGWETNGGRVILLSTMGADLEEAISSTYKTLDSHQSWNGLFYRNDIGRRAVNLAGASGSEKTGK